MQQDQKEPIYAAKVAALFALTIPVARDKITPMRAWWNWQTRWI